MYRRLRIQPGSRPHLTDRDTRSLCGLDDKEQGRARLAELVPQLADLHNRLWAESSRSLLLVLQGMDGSGKDGTVRSVFSGVNPRGCRVVSFRAPSEADLSHDYLWRVHQEVPRRGEIGIFNRSHYEDVLVPRARRLLPEGDIRRRLHHLVEFERMLVDEGTTIVKVHLQISPSEQRSRMRERLVKPAKNWKFRPDDLNDAAIWDRFMDAYELVLAETSTNHAPWYVVPADRKWVRNVVIAEILVATLQDLDPRIPAPRIDVAAGLARLDELEHAS